MDASDAVALEKKRADARTWYRANRDHRLAQNRKWRADHKDQLKEGSKKRSKKWKAAHRSEVNEQARVYRASHSPRTRRDNRFKRLYGISIEEYEKHYEAQQGKCAICFVPRKVLHVDHDHQTNKFRGLLCGACNSALGLFHENTEALTAAITYLLKNRKAVQDA